MMCASWLRGRHAHRSATGTTSHASAEAYFSPQDGDRPKPDRNWLQSLGRIRPKAMIITGLTAVPLAQPDEGNCCGVSAQVGAS